MLFNYTCKTCYKEFQHRKKDKKYCSFTYYNISKPRAPKLEFTCSHCNKKFQTVNQYCFDKNYYFDIFTLEKIKELESKLGISYDTWQQYHSKIAI